jgi:hypothetical protein
MTCNIELQEKGMPYPRTCKICKLSGKCMRFNSTAEAMVYIVHVCGSQEGPVAAFSNIATAAIYVYNNRLNYAYTITPIKIDTEK